MPNMSELPLSGSRFAGEFASVNYRYIAASNELNARTSQRQQALTIFISFFIGLLAALIAAHNASKGSDAHIEWILLGFPVASASFTFLNFKYELIITNLRQYLSELEQLGDAHLVIPSYNTNPKWVKKSNRGRRFHDYACAILIFACNSIGVSAFYVLFPERFNAAYWVLLIVFLVTLITAALQWLLPKAGYQVH